MASTVHLRLPLNGVSSGGDTVIKGNFTIGTSGAISSQKGVAGTVVKTASKTGRYTVTFDRPGISVHPLAPVLVGPTDSAFGNTAANVAATRNVSGTSFDIQLFLASSGADTETTSGNVVYWAAILKESGT